MSGDYISREALRQALTDKFKSRIGSSRIPTWNDAFDAVTNLPPAADVVEVRHGKWDLAKDPFGAGYVKCSRCGYKHCPEYYPDGSAIMHLFCPSCGAKMDGGQDDG